MIDFLRSFIRFIVTVYYRHHYDFIIMFYEENTTEINQSLFENDFDYVGWEPEVADDSDAEMAEQFGY